MFAMSNDSRSVFWTHHRSPYLRVMLLVLVIHLLIFVLSPPFQFHPYRLPPEEPMIVEEIPEIQLPPPPKEISMPVTFTAVTDNEPVDEIPPPLILNSVEDLSQLIQPGTQAVEPFLAFDELPIPIHFESPVYPELAREAGIEGIVHVKVTIDTNGKVVEANVLSSNVSRAMEQAALEAANKCLFKPAKQRNILVTVTIVIPFEFRLIR